MMFLKQLLLLFGLLAVAVAFIEFDKSRLYDEKDFEGHANISLNGYCSDGCRIYVSIPKGSFGASREMGFLDKRGKGMSFYDVFKTEGSDHLSLRPLVLKKPTMNEFSYNSWKERSDISLVNGNENLKSVPIAVWIIKEDAPNIDLAEVFNGCAYELSSSRPPIISTLFCAEPFGVLASARNLNASVDELSASIDVITGGFDAFGNCTTVVKDHLSYKWESLDIPMARSPLLTIVFDLSPGASGVFLFAPEDQRMFRQPDKRTHAFDLKRPMFVASPGYIGCDVQQGPCRTKYFRSSLYNATTEYNFASWIRPYTLEATDFSLYADMQLDTDHAVNIVANGETIKWSGNNTELSKSMRAEELKITWIRNENDPDQYFLIRLTQNAADGASFLFSCTFVALFCFL